MFTIDYIKLVVRNDGAADHQNMASSWLSLAEACNKDRKSYNLSVVGGKGGTRSLTVLEVWGEAADRFADFMATPWWGYLRRLDIREVIQVDAGNDTSLALDWAFLARPRNVNTAALDSKARHKSNKRDVGGRGLVIGSRKSARHAVFYKRGDEPAVYEFRAQDQLALEIGRKVVEDHDWSRDEGDKDAAISVALDASDDFLRKYYGTNNPSAIYRKWAAEGLAHDEQLEKLLAASQPADFWTEAADEYPDLPGLYDWPPSETE